jgi:hypothetical protein
MPPSTNLATARLSGSVIEIASMIEATTSY